MGEKKKYLIFITITNLISLLIGVPLAVFVLPTIIGLSGSVLWGIIKGGSLAGIVLAVIFEIYQRWRFNRVFAKEDRQGLFKTPLVISIHQVLNYFVGVIGVAVYINVRYHIPIGLILRVSGSAIIIALMIGTLTYLIPFNYLKDIFNKTETKGIKRLSILSRSSIILVIVILFAYFSGYLTHILRSGTILLILSFFILYFYIRWILLPIKIIQSHFLQSTEGITDMTKKLSLHTGDEFEEIAGAFNNFIQQIKLVTGKVKTSSEEVNNSSETLSSATTQMTAAVSEISKTVEEIAQEAQNSSRRIEDVRGEAEKITSLAKNIESQMKMASVSAGKANTSASEGESSAEEAATKMEDIYTSTQSSAEKVQNLVNATQNIMNFADMITDIAEQTDLLALNASVEAARVGEYGKGFAVVAEEIRTLALDTGKSANDVRKNIEEMKNAVEETVDMIKKNAKDVKVGKEFVEKARAKLEDIAKSVTLTTSMVKQVSQTSVEQRESTEEMFESIESMAKIYASTAAGVQELSASLQQQMASMEELEATAQNLNDIAQRMVEGLKKIKVK